MGWRKLSIWFGLCMVFLSAHATGYLIDVQIESVPENTLFQLRELETHKIINVGRYEKNKLVLRGELLGTPKHMELSAEGKKFSFSFDLLMTNDTLIIRGNTKDIPYSLTFEKMDTQIQYAAYKHSISELSKAFEEVKQQSKLTIDEEKRTTKAAHTLDYRRKLEEEYERLSVRLDTAKITYAKKHLSQPVGQFLLTSLMKNIPADTLRALYVSIPREHWLPLYSQQIIRFINPYAERSIREAELLLKSAYSPEEFDEVFRLYEQAVMLDSDKTDVYLAMGDLHEKLLPFKGVEAYDIGIEYYQKYIASLNDSLLIEAIQSKIRKVEERKRLAKTIEPEMVLVNGGTFVRGSAIKDDMNPFTTTTVDTFYISKYEITNIQFFDFINSYGSAVALEGEFAGKPLYYESNWGIEGGKVVPGYESHPAIYITWYGAKMYCEWQGGRLPTEDEWEYAARGGEKRVGMETYSGSEVLDSVGWYIGNSGKHPHPVGMKQPNPLGIYDMSGNIREWCEEEHIINGKEFRPVRGGTWFNDETKCRVAARYYNYPESKLFNNGIRLVKDKNAVKDNK